MTRIPHLPVTPAKPQPQFWALYHRLMDWADAEGFPDADKHDAAHWMNELYLVAREGTAKGDSVCRLALDAINANRPRVFPTGAKP